MLVGGQDMKEKLCRAAPKVLLECSVPKRKEQYESLSALNDFMASLAQKRKPTEQWFEESHQDRADA